jgi:hypothetical protein
LNHFVVAIPPISSHHLASIDLKTNLVHDAMVMPSVTQSCEIQLFVTQESNEDDGRGLARRNFVVAGGSKVLRIENVSLLDRITIACSIQQGL